MSCADVVEMMNTQTHEEYLAHKRSIRDNKRKCPICGKTFAKVEHQERHIRSHTKEKPFECRQCGRKYGRNDSLLRHLRYQHDSQRSNDIDISYPTKSSSDTQPRITSGDRRNQPETITPWSQTSEINAHHLDDLTGPLMTYHSQSNQTENFQSSASGVASWTQNATIADNAFMDDQQDGSGFENWLIDGFLDDHLLRNWPFVMNDADLSNDTSDLVHTKGKPLPDLQKLWYTRWNDKEEPAVSGSTTPLPGTNREVDDNYRQAIQQRLQIRAIDQSMPSADYLNLCLRSYFKHFQPVFPIIHAATFRPSTRNGPLLLSICSIGSLLTGHPDATPRGIQLFERLNKAILSNWESLMCRSPDENFAVIQASVIGQTFGLLSGQGNHLALVDTFHGTIIAWARRAKLFQATHQLSEHQDLEIRWRKWAQTEEAIRVGLAVRIHDAEIANTLHHEIFLPLATRRASVSDSDALFSASSPQEWIRLYRQAPTEQLATPVSETSPGFAQTPHTICDRLLSMPTGSYFSLYAALEDVLSAVMEARINESLSDDDVQKLHMSLIICYEKHVGDFTSTQFEGLQNGIKILWHFLFICINADLDLLEKSVGRDGPELSPSDSSQVQQWAQSSAAKRTVAHALMIKRILDHSPLASEPAIHVPRAMFFGAICIFCHSKYGDGSVHEHMDFPEFRVLNVDVSALLQETNGRKEGNDVDLGSICGIVDLLLRVGHWEVARKFASILSSLIHAESNC